MTKKKRISRRERPDLEVDDPPAEAHGWAIFAHPLLLQQLEALANRAEKAGANSEPGKVLAWLTQAMFEDIPQDPTLEKYRQGHTLGKENTHWFRDKYAGRFRLFFRYSLAAKIIVFAWVNDEKSKRTYGAKDDAYAVFRRMLGNGTPPNSWAALLREASSETAKTSLKGSKVA